jgi:hypothetical protein
MPSATYFACRGAFFRALRAVHDGLQSLHVGAPNLIGLSMVMCRNVAINAVLRMRLAGLRRLINMRETNLAYQPPNTPAARCISLDAAGGAPSGALHTRVSQVKPHR